MISITILSREIVESNFETFTGKWEFQIGQAGLKTQSDIGMVLPLPLPEPEPEPEPEAPTSASSSSRERLTTATGGADLTAT